MASPTGHSIASMLTIGLVATFLSACATRQDLRGWELVPGAAEDIAAGGLGSVWLVEQQHSDNNCNCVGRYNGATWERIAFPRYASRIAVDDKGNAWVATTVGEIYRFDGSKFHLFPGPTPFPNAVARDIAVGKNSSIWLVGRVKADNVGYQIHRYDGGSWTIVPGSGISVAANEKGNVWMLNGAGRAFQFDGTSFVYRFTAEPKAYDIGVSPEGVVWIATTQGTFLWNGFYLAGKGYPSYRITGAPNRAAWIANSTNIYRWVGPLLKSDQSE